MFAVLLLGGEWAIDAAFHPWAHAVLGSATLTGELVISGSTRHTPSGLPEWWLGRRVRLLLDMTAPAAPRGYQLREADAVWDGNTLALRARLAYYDEDGDRFASGTRLPLPGREVSIRLSNRAQAAE